jgi:hypothetical protein
LFDLSLKRTREESLLLLLGGEYWERGQLLSKSSANLSSLSSEIAFSDEDAEIFAIASESFEGSGIEVEVSILYCLPSSNWMTLFKKLSSSSSISSQWWAFGSRWTPRNVSASADLACCSADAAEAAAAAAVVVAAWWAASALRTSAASAAVGKLFLRIESRSPVEAFLALFPQTNLVPSFVRFVAFAFNRGCGCITFPTWGSCGAEDVGWEDETPEPEGEGVGVTEDGRDHPCPGVTDGEAVVVSLAVTRREWLEETGSGTRDGAPLGLDELDVVGKGVVAGDAEFFSRNFLLTLTALNRFIAGTTWLEAGVSEAADGGPDWADWPVETDTVGGLASADWKGFVVVSSLEVVELVFSDVSFALGCTTGGCWSVCAIDASYDADAIEVTRDWRQEVRRRWAEAAPEGWSTPSEWKSHGDITILFYNFIGTVTNVIVQAENEQKIYAIHLWPQSFG